MSRTPDERFPLAEFLYLRIADDAHAIEQGVPNLFLEASTPVTAELLRWWFQNDYRQGREHNFHSGQRDAILAVIYAHEVLGTTSLYDLYNQVAPESLLDGRLGRVTADHNQHPKYAAKMATGTGKTWVLNALLIWQYLNHRANPSDERFSSNFLLVTPGLVVYERLLDSFQGKVPPGLPMRAGAKQRDFETSDISVQQELFLPPQHRSAVFAFLTSSVVTKREIGRKVTGSGIVAITNWHLLAGQEDPDFVDDELDIDAPGLDIDERTAAASFVPLTPGRVDGNALDSLDRRWVRGSALQSLIDLPGLVVFNDEAHHIHQIKRGEEITDVEWQKSLTRIAEGKGRRFTQIDFSATPYNEQGTGERAKRLYFDHIVVDFPLHAAMREGLVKALAIDKRSEIAALSNEELEFRVERDESGSVISLSDGQRVMIRAGLKKLAILEEQFPAHDPEKHPKLLIMTEDTASSKIVEDFLVETGLDRDEDILRVDSNRKGELGEKEWAPLKERLFGIDRLKRPKVIVSVLMLREGFDVSNICVIVPLRSAGSGILAEQTIGRGLRLMWRGDEAIEDLKRETRQRILQRQQPQNYLDVLFIVEHPRFVNLYEELLGEGLAVELTNEIGGTSVTGDLESLGLRQGYAKYDFEVPIILKSAEEELRSPSIDISALPASKYPIDDLIRQIGTGDRFASEDAQTGTRFGDYRVDGGVMTATGYNDYLSRMTNRITESISRTFIGAEGHDRGQYSRSAQYPILQTFKPLLAGRIDQYIRNRAFGPAFDPLNGDNWRVLLVGDVSQEIAGAMSSALVESLDSAEVAGAEVDYRWVSEVATLSVRSSTSIEVTKSIFEKLPVAARGGGLERMFIDWADSDASVDAIVKIDEFRHWFLHRAYLKADGMPAYYSPDFLVRTSGRVFVVETKAQSMLNEANVLRKQRAALAWVDQINELPPEHRSGSHWDYVLLGSKTADDWRTKGGSVISLLVFASLKPRDSVEQPTLL